MNAAKTIHFYSIRNFEDWDWTNSIEKGIGGSETSAVEMAWRLARRGYDVRCYAPVPWGKDGGERAWRGTRWSHYEAADLAAPGWWIYYRCPAELDKVPDAARPGQQRWLMCQDAHYQTVLNEERGAKLDRVIVLCEWHRQSMAAQYPFLAEKLWITTNGVKLDLLREVEAAIAVPKKVFAFDWGGTLEINPSVRSIAQAALAAGHDVHLVPALGTVSGLTDADIHALYEKNVAAAGVPGIPIHRVGDGRVALDKQDVLKAIKADYFWDDLESNVEAARAIGVKATQVTGVTPVPMPQLGHRNPHKLIWASSPDRGLLPLLDIFRKAKEFVPDLELHVFYGFNNIDTLTAGQNSWADSLLRSKREIQARLTQPGVVWRGRVSQQELYREWLSAGIWCQPTSFHETSCITCMEAQALGAVPIFNPIGALRDNVGCGIVIAGDPATDKLVQSRYVGEIVRLCREPAFTDGIRQPMMRWARSVWNWERPVDQWECAFLGWPQEQNHQFLFQHKHATGRVLNVGCDEDASGWRAKGAVNLDVRWQSPVTKKANAAHVIHDIRNQLPCCLGLFDTIILGDIMEHIADAEWDRVLAVCRDGLTAHGQILITCPDDGAREWAEQHMTAQTIPEPYAAGVPSFHTRAITRADIERHLAAVGLEVVLYQPIDYSLFEGHGIVARRLTDGDCGHDDRERADARPVGQSDGPAVHAVPARRKKRQQPRATVHAHRRGVRRRGSQ